MKRLTLFFLIVLLFTLAGCGTSPAGITPQETDAPTASPASIGTAPNPEPTNTPEPTSTPEPIIEETEENTMHVEVNGQRFTLTLADNDTARAFAALLPVTFEMEELNGNEKFIYLDEALPSASDAVGHIEAGDLMLYGSSCVVLFYDSFSTPYSYTRIGRLDDPSGVAEAVERGDVAVTFGIDEP